jgi:hypothetical protein
MTILLAIDVDLEPPMLPHLGTMNRDVHNLEYNGRPTMQPYIMIQTLLIDSRGTLDEFEDTTIFEMEMTTNSKVVETTIHWVPVVSHIRGRDTR